MGRRSFLFALLFTSWSGTVAADMIDTSSLQPWETCALCHGIDGVSRMAKFPRLAGQPVHYLIKQLKDFRGAHRRNDDNVMADNAGLLKPEELRRVAAYFSAQDAPAPIAPDPGADLAHGSELFRHGRASSGTPACVQCHGDATENARHPHITAQHPAYIAKQLRDFREKTRDNDPNGVMRHVASTLTDRDIEAVAAYAGNQARQE